MKKKDIMEGLGELADIAERDHEVQMARAELYKLAKYAVKLHDMLKRVSEAEGLEGWVQSKITKSADMIGSVYHHLDYEESPMAEGKDKKPVADKDKMVVRKVDKDGNTKAYQNMKAGNPNYIDKTNESLDESQKDTHCSDKCCGSDVKREDCKCAPDCKHCNCNDDSIPEGKSPHKKGTKKYKKHMAAKHANMGESYKDTLTKRLNQASQK